MRPTDQEIIDHLERMHAESIFRVLDCHGSLAIEALLTIVAIDEQRSFVRNLLTKLFLEGRLDIAGGTVRMPSASMRVPRPYTKDEASRKLVGHMISIAEEWANLEGDRSPMDRMKGMLHSILVLLDGGTMAFPRIDLVPQYCPEDVDFLREQCRNWLAPNEPINDECSLHDLFNSMEHERKAAEDVG